MLGMRNWAELESEAAAVQAFERLAVFLCDRYPDVLLPEIEETHDSDRGWDEPLYAPDDRLLSAVTALQASPESRDLVSTWPSPQTTRNIYTYYPHAAGRLLETLFGMRALRNFETLDEQIIDAMECSAAFVIRHCPEALREESPAVFNDPDREQAVPYYAPDPTLVHMAGEIASKYALSV